MNARFQWTLLVLLQQLTCTVSGPEHKNVVQCHPGTMTLLCTSGMIHIQNVVLGETDCWWNIGRCCPTPNDCTRRASSGHTRFVHEHCDNRQKCEVNTVREVIECNGGSEFERITYQCVPVQPAPTVPTPTLSTSHSISPQSSSTSWSSSASYNQTTSSWSSSSPSNELVPDVDEDNTDEDALDDYTKDSLTDIDIYIAAYTNKPSPTAIIVLVVIITFIIVIVGIFVKIIHLNRRRKDSMKSGSNNGSSFGFRHLEANERNQDAVASNEPIYELESPVPGDRESSVPLIVENVYSEPAGEQDTADTTVGLYSEPDALNNGVYHLEMKVKSTEAPSGDLMVHENTDNEYDEVLFKNREVDPVNYIYGGVGDDDQGQVDDSVTNIYSDPTPWNEAAYGAVGMKPLHPESEYMVPRPATVNKSPPVTSSPPCADSVYYSMDRSVSEKST